MPRMAEEIQLHFTIGEAYTVHFYDFFIDGAGK